MENTQVKDVILCDCNSSEHQMLIFYDPNDEDPKDAYLHVHLVTKRSFIARFKYAIKYLFGYKSRFGAWDEFILNPDDANKLQAVVDYLKSLKKNVV